MAATLTPPQGVHERFEGVGEVQVVVDFVHGRRAGRSVLELKHAEAGFDPVWRRNGWGDCRWAKASLPLFRTVAKRRTASSENLPCLGFALNIVTSVCNRQFVGTVCVSLVPAASFGRPQWPSPRSRSLRPARRTRMPQARPRRTSWQSGHIAPQGLAVAAAWRVRSPRAPRQ